MNRLYDLNNIAVSYGGTFTLQIKALSLQAGRLYAVTGNNGSGKSTLLKLLALIRRPVKGSLSFEGEVVGPSDAAALRNAITLVEQTPYLFNGTVAKNLEYGLKLRGIKKAERILHIAKALDRVGLAGCSGNRRRELSRGQIQRVAVARALVLEPKVLLLDEPTASSDRGFAGLFAGLVRELIDAGATVIMATHDLGMARDLGAEVLVLEHGQLAEPACRKSEPAHSSLAAKHHGPVA